MGSRDYCRVCQVVHKPWRGICWLCRIGETVTWMVETIKRKLPL